MTATSAEPPRNPPTSTASGNAQKGESHASRPVNASGQKAVSRRVVGWGVVVGIATASAPLAFFWLPASTVNAMSLSLIAAIYVGFAVADGRVRVIVAESAVAGCFVVLAGAAVTLPWLIVGGLVLHGFKDLWQHRSGFVRGTRWWPPFCVATDWVAALIVTVAIIVGVPSL